MNVFNILPHQIPFVFSDKPNILCSGGFRSGKTYAGALRALMFALKFPGSRGFVGGISIVRHIMGKLIPLIKEDLIDEGIINKNIADNFFKVEEITGRNILKIITNYGVSTMEFFPLEKTGMESKFISREFDWAWIDEAILCNEQAVKQVQSRLSGKNALVNGSACFWISTFPGDPSHWLKEWFDSNRKYDWVHTTMCTYENTSNLESYFERMRQNNPGQRGQKYIYGKWVADNDAFFDYGKHREWTGTLKRDFFQHIVSWCDPATMVGDDYTSIVTMGLLNGDYVILDIDRSKTWEITETTNAMIRMNNKWRPHQFYIESNGVGQPILEYARRNGMSNLVGKHTKEKKEVKALPVQAIWNNGHIYWSHYDDSIIREFCGFPHATNDDVVDCVSGCYSLLAGSKPTPLSFSYTGSLG